MAKACLHATKGVCSARTALRGWHIERVALLHAAVSTSPYCPNSCERNELMCHNREWLRARPCAREVSLDRPVIK